jgi:erythromycin esterase-like protein
MILLEPASATGVLAEAAHRLDGLADCEALARLAGNARIVLIGEASHGTHEFYEFRAQVTRRLIEEYGFRILALEADWPDMLRVHRYVSGQSGDDHALVALGDFRRFPVWMWRNAVMVGFIEWLKTWNETHRAPVGMFGMDLYSLHASIDEVLRYLDRTDPAAARRARDRYNCFEMFGNDPQNYGLATTRGGAESCEGEVTAQLAEMQLHYGRFSRRDGKLEKDELFYAEQNARLVANAESYYRAMFRGRDTSWNIRDEHMTETIAELAGHFDGKIVVWAHNSHLGDARATEMSERGEWNIGQLVRQHHADEVFSIGFSTYSGTVTAARDWSAPAERRRVRPALPGSYEELFHTTGIPAFWLDLRRRDEACALLRERRLQRAIGVIYRPETERWSHYFETCLPGEFDVIVHIDETHALEPVERNSEWIRTELPETYPEGL